jgi:hypothetical protein
MQNFGWLSEMGGRKVGVAHHFDIGGGFSTRSVARFEFASDKSARHITARNPLHPFCFNGFTAGCGGLKWGRFWGVQRCLVMDLASY